MPSQHRRLEYAHRSHHLIRSLIRNMEVSKCLHWSHSLAVVVLAVAALQVWANLDCNTLSFYRKVAAVVRCWAYILLQVAAVAPPRCPHGQDRKVYFHLYARRKTKIKSICTLKWRKTRGFIPHNICTIGGICNISPTYCDRICDIMSLLLMWSLLILSVTFPVQSRVSVYIYTALVLIIIIIMKCYHRKPVRVPSLPTA